MDDTNKQVLEHINFTKKMYFIVVRNKNKENLVIVHDRQKEIKAS